GAANAELAVVVRAPAPEGALTLHGAGVSATGADAHPGAGVDQGRQALVVGVPGPQAAVVAEAPAPERAVDTDAAVVVLAAVEHEPVVGRPHLRRRIAGLRGGQGLAGLVQAPAPHGPVGGEAAAVLLADRDVREEGHGRRVRQAHVSDRVAALA